VLLKTGDLINSQTVDGISFVPAMNDCGTVVIRELSASLRRGGGDQQLVRAASRKH
jgi:hypothetical protein